MDGLKPCEPWMHLHPSMPFWCLSQLLALLLQAAVWLLPAWGAGGWAKVHRRRYLRLRALGGPAGLLILPSPPPEVPTCRYICTRSSVGMPGISVPPSKHARRAAAACARPLRHLGRS